MAVVNWGMMSRESPGGKTKVGKVHVSVKRAIKEERETQMCSRMRKPTPNKRPHCSRRGFYGWTMTSNCRFGLLKCVFSSLQIGFMQSFYAGGNAATLQVASPAPYLHFIYFERSVTPIDTNTPSSNLQLSGRLWKVRLVREFLLLEPLEQSSSLLSKCGRKEAVIFTAAFLPLWCPGNRLRVQFMFIYILSYKITKKREISQCCLTHVPTFNLFIFPLYCPGNGCEPVQNANFRIFKAAHVVHINIFQPS